MAKAVEKPPESPQEPAEAPSVLLDAVNAEELKRLKRLHGRLHGTAFPLDSFRVAARHLRRPFTPAAVKFKAQTNLGEKGTIAIAHIDARLVVERLNLIVPHLWRDEYKPLDGKHLLCKLTVDEIARYDVGEGVGKGAYSDALKRAAVKFGVGVSLYAIPQAHLWLSEHGKYIKPKKNKEGKTYFEITPEGRAALRRRYENWLGAVGVQQFGEPLDHGDTEVSAGDPEGETPEQEEADEPIYELLDTEKAEALREQARAAYKEWRDLGGEGMLPGAFNIALRNAGHSIKALGEFVETIRTFDVPEETL